MGTRPAFLRVAVGTICAIALAAPALAEPLPDLPPRNSDPFRALAEIKTRDEIWERSFDSLYEQVLAGWRADPVFAKASERCPGLADVALEAARPIMREGHFKQRDPFRDGLTRLFTEGMTADQARAAYDFYASPDGRYLLEVGTDASSQQAKIAAGETPIERETFDADLRATQANSIERIDPTVLERAEAAIRASTWFAPYRALHPRIQDLRFRISRDPAAGETEADKRLMLEATQRATAQRIANCRSGAIAPAPSD